MEKQMIFHILGMEETKDEQAIRDAYRTLLRVTNPEDNPEGFKRLREAYEEALELARQPEENKDKEKSEIDLWVERVDTVYRDIRIRYQTEAWQELLADPLCEDLDTSLQTREALLVYFMDHIYLPHKIWKLLDQQFQIVEDRENLLQKFPKDFLDYIIYYIEHESFINYEIFQVIEKDKMDADAYIRNYLDIKRQIDQGQTDGMLKRLDELEVFGIRHPYAEAERLRLLSAYGDSWRSAKTQTEEETDQLEEESRQQKEESDQKEGKHLSGKENGHKKETDQQKEENDCKEESRQQKEKNCQKEEKHPSQDENVQAQEEGIRESDEKPDDGNILLPQVLEAQVLADKLLEQYGKDSYILLYCGEARWAGGKKEEAYHIWQRILEDWPDHYTAKYGVARYFIVEKDYEKAKELMMELLNTDGRDEAVLEDMRETNEALIAQYKKSISAEDTEKEQKSRDTVELGWCLFQNEYVDEAIEILKDFVPDEEETYSYENLYGRLLYKAEKYEEALPHLLRWLELIQETPEDGSEENEKRISREYRACHILSGCYYEMKQMEQALEYVDLAIEKAPMPQDKQACMQYKAFLLFENQQYKESIDVCDQILELDEGYFPAVLQRQEAAYELKNGQQVVDDYYRAIRIFDGYYKPYMLAAQAFFYSNQFSDALGVLNRARENHVEFSANMKLYEVKILRNLAEEKKDREKPFAIAEELLEAIKDPDMDIEDPSEVEYEIALLYWDDNDFDQALEHLKTAIEQNENRLQYRMIRGHIYLDKKAYKAALKEYSAAEPVYGKTPALHYNCGLCHENLGMKKLAMESYEKALQCQEAYRDANEKLADYYKEKYNSTYDEADFEKAMGYLDRQLQFRESCYYLVERGRLFMSAYRLEEAIREFEKALALEPDDWASYNNMGCCYKYMGQFEKGIECLEKAVQYMGESKSVLPYSNMADCYEALENYEKAIWCYEKDLEMFPDRKTFRKEIGLLYQYIGDYENALKYFQMEPGLDDYYDNMASVIFLQGKTKAAIKMYEEGIRKASREDKTKRLRDLGYFYKEILGDFKKGERYYQKALAAAMTEDERHETEWELAALCFRMGKKPDAKLHAKSALEHFKKSESGIEENYLNYQSYRPARLMRFAWIYICLGQTEKGLEMFQEMLRSQRCRQCRYKGCFEAYQFLGMYYEAIGDQEKTYENYKKAFELNNHGIATTIAWKRVQKNDNRN